MICSVNIKRAFYNNKQVLENIYFEIDKGDILAIVGESGAGKTTLARIISGLHTFYPLTYEGYIKTKGTLDIIPQNITDSLDPLFRIEDQLKEIESNEEKIKNTLNKVGFDDVKSLLKSYPHNLSGGMKQRILIAMALLRAQVLIADEFTSALDSITKIKVLKLLKNLNKKENVTIIFITHDIDLLNVEGKMMVLFDGKIVEMGNISEIKNNPLHPYTKFLLFSSPKEDMHYTKARFPEIFADKNMACPFANSCKSSDSICKTQKPPLKNKKGRLVRCHF